ncbi:MAG TPA: MBL fold metallo-hydrolase, partial [Myxococcota bacterium]|nr:MBL fold metallo-hydrolase [Myxococcota bacterium]
TGPDVACCVCCNRVATSSRCIPGANCDADVTASVGAARYAARMPKVWTRRRAGTPEPGPARLVRSPAPNRPEIHQIVLPLAPRDTRSSAAPSSGWALDSVQVYLIEDEPLTLVDTGVRSAASRIALESALDELGYGLSDLRRIVLTHAHRDHMGLVETIRSLSPDLECWVHEADAAVVEDYGQAIRDRIEQLSSLFLEHGVPTAVVDGLHADRLAGLAVDEAEGEATRVTRRLRDGDAVAGKRIGLRVHHAPGHTPGHVLLEDEASGVLLTGDLVMGQAMPHAETCYLDEMAMPGDPARRRPRFRGLVEMRRSLRRLRGRPFGVLLPGYGGVLRRADRAIRDTLLYYDVRIQRIERGLRHLAAMGQDVTVYELWKSLFPPDEAPGPMRSHLLLLIGALDCLEEDGAVVTERREDGVLTHHHR